MLLQEKALQKKALQKKALQKKALDFCLENQSCDRRYYFKIFVIENCHAS